MGNRLDAALLNLIWIQHQIGDFYTMKGDSGIWKIAYYPIFEDGKTGEIYAEPRALFECPIINGTNFREVPLRYIQKVK